MRSFFEFAYRLRISSGLGPNGEAFDASQMISWMRDDEAEYEIERSGAEHHWRTTARSETEEWVSLLVGTARYLSDLIGGDLPVMAPRDVVEASTGVGRKQDGDAILIGKSITRAIQKQIDGNSAAQTQAHLAEIERMIAGIVNAAPAHSKWLTTDQVAARLHLSRATVERKFRSGELEGDKTAGNQWRTTEERLRRSPYLKKKGRKRADVE